MELFPSISEFLGLPILLDIFRMTLPVLRQVVRVLIQPFFDAGVIVLAAIGILPSPARIVLGFAGFSYRRDFRRSSAACPLWGGGGRIVCSKDTLAVSSRSSFPIGIRGIIPITGMRRPR